MIRIASLALFTAAAALLAADSARAQLPVAPAPREVRPDGSRDPAPKAEAPAKAEDPAAVVDRIIKNSKDVGDRLEKTDTGTDTQKKQAKVLADIDTLLNQQENPPPPQPDQNKDKDDKQDDKKDMKDPKNDMNMKDMPPPKGDMPMDKKDMGMGKGMDQGMPMGGTNDQQPMPMGRKPRMGDPMGGDKKEPNKPDQAKNDKKPAGQKDPKDPKNSSGMAGGMPGGKPPPKASLPFDDDVAKDVWGHLPDKLRRQMTQYYREDVMPKYAELLRLYYSSLAEKAANPPNK
jgi:hypothetical protein